MTDDDILLQFLDANLINVGSDDTKLEKLQSTAKDLALALKKTPAQTVRWTLVAADPEVSADDPVITQAWSALKKNWTTVSNSYQSVPVALLRATLLDALVQAVTKEETIAVAFANTARNMLPHMPLGQEAPVWQNAIARIEDLVDERAEADWRTPEQIKIAPMVYDLPGAIQISSGNKVTNRDVLQAKILAATGPHNGSSDPNPYWSHNQPQPWSQEFATRLAPAIADAIDSVVKANRVEPVDLSPPLKTIAAKVGDYVDSMLAAFSGATAGLQRRTNLLWWKEALYSASSRTSYRDMNVFTATSLMALDLFEQVPLFTPASVSAFLHEAILVLPDASRTKPLPVAALVDQLLQDPLTKPLRERARKLEPAAEGRRPLLGIIGHLDAGSLGAAAFRQARGFDDTVAMAPDSWGVHLFRELQAARASQTSKRPHGKA